MDNTLTPPREIRPNFDLSVLDTAKWAFSTRRVNKTDIVNAAHSFDTAKPGDLILGQVTQIGSHKRVQLQSGRPSTLYEGDFVVLACGARYAADQFLGSATIAPDSFDMLAGGGCGGTMELKNTLMKAPTKLRPVGMLLGSNQQHLNLKHFALSAGVSGQRIPAFLVVGASMNSGKTTATAALTHGLSKAGERVGAIKLTGTGAFGDFNAYEDAGANYVGDMVDAGYVSTVGLSVNELVEAYECLSTEAASRGCDVLVVELADGVLQRETAALLRSDDFMKRFDGVIYTAGDSLSVVGGLHVLRGLNITPVAVSGLVSTSPLSTQEAIDICGCAIYTQAELSSATVSSVLFNQVSPQ